MITDKALHTPLSNKLKGKRVILASSSPRSAMRKAFSPEVVPSTFDELLPHGDYAGNLGAYAAATAQEKAIQVYTSLVEKSSEIGEDPPDLVISADTIVVTSSDSGEEERIFEKPGNKIANLDMLHELNGKKHTIYSAVCIVYPVLYNPGYECKQLLEHTNVYFNDNPEELLETYAECGEGWDRAGGFAIQQRGGILVQRIEGDYNTAIGFPASAFYKYMAELLENDELFPDE